MSTNLERLKATTVNNLLKDAEAELRLSGMTDDLSEEDIKEMAIDKAVRNFTDYCYTISRLELRE